MAGTREGLELRARYSFDTVPVYLLKGNGFYAEANAPRNIVFGTEIQNTAIKRELLSIDNLK